MGKIKKCVKCNLYTLKTKCDLCGIETQNVVPPKFSPEDKYGIYRRKMKKRLEYV